MRRRPDQRRAGLELHVREVGSGSVDFWSRPEDVRLLREHLVHARRVEAITIEEATHFVHLDRPERGRARFMRAVLSFLASE